MRTTLERIILSIAFSGIIGLAGLIASVEAQEQYTSEDLYTIPWGYEQGHLSTQWNVPSDSPNWKGLYDPPGPWAMSSEGEMVIVDYERLMTFASDGSLAAHISLESIGLEMPFDLAINPDGRVLIENHTWSQSTNADIVTYYLFDSDLELANQASAPAVENTGAFPLDIFPSSSQPFWIILMTDLPMQDGTDWYEILLFEYEDGDLSSPEQLYAGEDSDPGPNGPRFITPSGDILSDIQDMYGFIYKSNVILGEYAVRKYTPEGELVAIFDYSSDTGWEGFIAGSPKWYVTWAGDVYVLHATDDGAVLTKYTYNPNHDPCCDLVVVTSMPASGIGQVPVEFDASGSYDPDPGDTLSFAWDFDGDNVYGETVHDSYTGDPDNPTHIYYVSYTGPVRVKVTDGHDGESICSVNVQVTVIDEN